MNILEKNNKPFVFTANNKKKVRSHIAKYPEGREQSAVLPVLDIAQRQCGGWLPQTAINTVAKILDMPKIRILEVATFYSMFNLEPVGENIVQVCTTTPCWLRGSADIIVACEEFLQISIGETTHDRKFTLCEVECLGACVNGPLMQIGRSYFEDLTPKNTISILETYSRGEEPKAGSQLDRNTSAPANGLTSLKNWSGGNA